MSYIVQYLSSILPSIVVVIGHYLFLSIVSCVSFWCQSVVTEERLVPALNVISDYYNIPDDIAGATLMAAGASSPELLCTLVSLFLTHSSLGLGTIVGSEIFNQLIICAGSVYASKTHHTHNTHAQYGSKYLVLDKVMVLREVSFYALSILLLYISLSVSRTTLEMNEEGVEEVQEEKELIYVSFPKALLLFAGYVLYVIVCANMEWCLFLGCWIGGVMRRWCNWCGCCNCCSRWLYFWDKRGDGMGMGLEDGLGSGGGNEVEAVSSNAVTQEGELCTEYSLEVGRGSVHHKSFDDHDIHQLPFIYNISTEPIENWEADPSPAAENGHHYHIHNDPIVICNSSASHVHDEHDEHDEHEEHDAAKGDAHNERLDTVQDTEPQHSQPSPTEKKRRNILSRALHKSFYLLTNQHAHPHKSNSGDSQHTQHMQQSQETQPTRQTRHKYPIHINDVYELTNEDGSHEIRCYLWQRSVFYSRAYFGSHAFHLRWFTIKFGSEDNNCLGRISSVPEGEGRHDGQDGHDGWDGREDQGKKPKRSKCLIYPPITEIQIDPKRYIINMKHPTPGKKDILVMAHSKAVFEAVVAALEVCMKKNREVERELKLLGVQDVTSIRGEDEALGDLREDWESEKRRVVDVDDHVDLIEFPSGASRLEQAVWVFLFPLRVVMHYTLPDVRHLNQHGDPTKSIGFAFLSTTMCLLWLILGSYVMVTSLEALAALMQVPESVVGFTVSAAGTSLPAYVASRVAAEKGFGNQAVANVFGSNTFNICIGLGLPWTIYTLVFGPYHDLEKDGILESILILAGVLLVFVVLMIRTNFVLVKWHADLFVGLYVAYVVFAICRVFY